jgi:hypothetical protein
MLSAEYLAKLSSIRDQVRTEYTRLVMGYPSQAPRDELRRIVDTYDLLESPGAASSRPNR